MDIRNLPQRVNRPATSARQYLGKPALTRAEIGRRAAALLPDDAVVNLGAGLPVQVANWVTERPVVLHAENGLLNYGGFATDEDFDPDLHDAGGHVHHDPAGHVVLRLGDVVRDRARRAAVRGHPRARTRSAATATWPTGRRRA